MHSHHILDHLDHLYLLFFCVPTWIFLFLVWCTWLLFQPSISLSWLSAEPGLMPPRIYRESLFVDISSLKQYCIVSSLMKTVLGRLFHVQVLTGITSHLAHLITTKLLTIPFLCNGFQTKECNHYKASSWCSYLWGHDILKFKLTTSSWFKLLVLPWLLF